MHVSLLMLAFSWKHTELLAWLYVSVFKVFHVFAFWFAVWLDRYWDVILSFYIICLFSSSKPSLLFRGPHVDPNVSMSLQVFVNFAKQQSREDDAIVLHPKAAGAQRYIDTTPVKSVRRWTQWAQPEDGLWLPFQGAAVFKERDLWMCVCFRWLKASWKNLNLLFQWDSLQKSLYSVTKHIRWTIYVIQICSKSLLMRVWC